MKRKVLVVKVIKIGKELLKEDGEERESRLKGRGKINICIIYYLKTFKRIIWDKK